MCEIAPPPGLPSVRPLQFLHANLDGQSVRPVVPVMVKLLQLGYQV